jgi:hypothetical protein
MTITELIDSWNHSWLVIKLTNLERFSAMLATAFTEDMVKQ